MYNQQVQKTGQTGKLEGTWWVAAVAFTSLMQYWHVTGDAQFNQVVSAGMYAQKGENNNYFPEDKAPWLGNDDQVFWGLAAVTAAEFNFPEDSKQPSWVALAQGVFNDQVPRWDNSVCGGGLPWQAHFFQKGYNLKNAVSNGGLFQLASRLAFYTNNQTYADWATKIYTWSTKVPLIMEDTWFVADSVNDDDQCHTSDKTQWTYNYGLYLGGSAYMYNHVSFPFLSFGLGMLN